MRRFRFPLDPVLRLRRQLEEQAQLEMAEAARQLEHRKAEVEATRHDLRRHDAYRAEMQQSLVHPGSLAHADHYREELVLLLGRQLEALQHAQARWNESARALHQRHVDSEILERFRAHRREEYRAQELSAEQQSMDEATALRWRRD